MQIKRVKKILGQLLIPKPLRKFKYNIQIQRELVKHLLNDYGWKRSLKEGKCIDKAGLPIPWFTYPAIDFLKQLDFSEKSVFEYGSGYSTMFWGARAKRVVSVENDIKWIQKIKPTLSDNCEIVPALLDADDYSGKISAFGNFDVIVIDGYILTRTACCHKALQHLNAGGIIILDNSDRCLQSASILRNAGLIQSDFTGFTPLNPDAQTTTVFFSRDYNFEPLNGYQPHKSVAQPYDPYPNG